MFLFFVGLEGEVGISCFIDFEGFCSFGVVLLDFEGDVFFSLFFHIFVIMVCSISVTFQSKDISIVLFIINYQSSLLIQ